MKMIDLLISITDGLGYISQGKAQIYNLSAQVRQLRRGSQCCMTFSCCAFSQDKNETFCAVRAKEFKSAGLDPNVMFLRFRGQELVR